MYFWSYFLRAYFYFFFFFFGGGGLNKTSTSAAVRDARKKATRPEIAESASSETVFSFHSLSRLGYPSLRDPARVVVFVAYTKTAGRRWLRGLGKLHARSSGTEEFLSFRGFGGTTRFLLDVETDADARESWRSFIFISF